ncbi:uncharacterized protein LOC142585248 [Dermacentor variabilis]|uniref:uncharacterized protein LOC142585248 n=1 Tax=Dermacentor variabilis TaxID=34621 RepID=UPI003F5C9D52
MSQIPPKRYRQYLQPGSSSQVPRQTRKYVSKRTTLTTATTKNTPANLNSLPTDSTCGNITQDHSDNSRQNSSSLAEIPAGANASAIASSVEEEISQAASERDVHCDEDARSFSGSELNFASQLSSDSDPQETDETDSNDEESAQMHDDEGTGTEAAGDDDFMKYFAKLRRETLPHQATTKAEAFLLVLTYIVTAGLTWAQVQGLLTLINALFGEKVVPCTTYSLRKLWKSKKEALRVHLYCQACHKYLGLSCDAKNKSTVTCASCGAEKRLQELMSSGSFFLMFNLKQQLLELLKQVGRTLHTNLQKLSSGPLVPGVFSDITDGSLYRSVRKQINMAWSDITLTFNSDGAPVFDSSKSTIWPIQVMLNELPVLMRWQNVLVSGLWFSRTHPPMHLFMTQFVEEVSNVGTLVWSHAGRTIRSAVHAVVCCVDSPARAAILNSKQFNGYFGCSWCLQQGEVIDGTLKYSFCSDVPGRTHSGVLKAMVEAVQKKEPVFGIKGPSTLIKLRGFDLVWGLPPDYMHCVLEGVTKQVTEMWLSATGSTWYIGRHIKLIDSRLLLIKPPIIFSRSGRPLSDRAFWKAAEWRSWLLFYSLPCVSDILPRPYLTHFALLAKAVFLLLKDVILEDEICAAERSLLAFVQQMAKLYGQNAMTFNVHQLLHLTKSTRMFGPLWATSTFPFEDGIGRALQLVTAAKYVPAQIAERCIMHQTFRTVSVHMDLQPSLLSAKKELEHSYKRCSQTCVLGQAQPVVYMPDILKGLFVSRFGNVPQVSKYFRAQVGTMIIHSSEYCVPSKTCSCYVKMSDGMYCLVLGIYAKVGVMYFHCQQLLTTPCAFDVLHILECQLPPTSVNNFLYCCDEVSLQCVFLSVCNKSYLCELPNRLEKN